MDTIKIDINKKAGIPEKYASQLLEVSDDTTLHSEKVYQDSEIDVSWFKKQYDFVKSLSPKEVFYLKSYTKHGDVFINTLAKIKDVEVLKIELMKLVNNLRTKKGAVNIFQPLKLELIQPDNVIQIVSIYAEQVINIFKKAPPVEKPLRVFRGVRPPRGESPTIYPLSGIVSTTYNPIVVEDFVSVYDESLDSFKAMNAERKTSGKLPIKNCCIYDMILRPGVKAIWVEGISNYPTESEIILLPNIIQASFSHSTDKEYVYREQTKTFQTYDVVVSPITGKTLSMKGGKTKRSKRRYRKTYKK